MSAHSSTRAAVAALGAAILLAFAAPASAQPSEGQFRLHNDNTVVGISFFPDVVGVYQVGLTPSQLGFGASYMVLENLAIGARTSFGFVLVDPAAPGDSIAGQISLLPFVEAVLPMGETMAAFVGGQLGFVADFPDVRDPYASLTAGAFGGIHIFASDSFSISPFGQLNFLYRGDAERAGFQIVLGFSLVGWIGGGESPGGGAQPAAEPTWQPSGGAAPPPATDPVYDPEGGLQ
ncbi:MAG: hypothetical protein VYE22_09395 [Myxococcota bacterium]|nr:hypothetical protein [Myxococcota bacterium]